VEFSFKKRRGEGNKGEREKGENEKSICWS